MRDPADVTPQQAEILDVLWELGDATVAQVREHILRGSDLARTTVTTVLSRMVEYGWTTRESRGREFVYRAAITRRQLRAAQIGRVLRAIFPGDLPSLVSHALREGDWESEDLVRIEEMVRRHRARLEPEDPDA